MRLKIILLCCLMAGLFAKQVRSTHLIGGEIYYECLNPAIGSYLFTVKLYRDCYTGVPPFDDPIFVSIYTLDNSGNFVLYIQMEMVLPPPDTLENNTYNFCLYSPPDICVEAAVYEQIYILPPGEYYLTYQRCCRNQGILNIPNPQSVGFGFDIVVPDTNLAVCNSSPAYNNYPPTIICLDAPFEYDHSATDPDGDSLVYYLCAPKDYDNFTWGIVPNPSGPPISNVTMNYLPPFDSLYPITAVVDSFKIDPVTGLLTGTPTQAGRYVVAVCVSEYRNGVLLSTNSRDFQFNIAACLEDPLLQFTSEPDPCDHLTMTFTYQGNTVASYAWDFGVDSLISDTSNLENPSYTYPGTGTYPVTLIVNENYYCADTLTINVTPPPPDPSVTAIFSTGDGCIGDITSFFDSSTTTFGNIILWGWDFGDGNTSTAQNPTHTYADTGTYTVTLVPINDSACADTMIQLVTIAPMPVVDLGASDSICIVSSVPLSGSVQFASGGTWTSSGTGTFTPSADSLTTTYNPSPADTSAGSVTLTLTSTGNLGSCPSDSQSIVASFNAGPQTSSIIGWTQVSPLSQVQYGVSQTLGSTYNWIITGGSVLTGQGSYVMEVQWGNAGMGQVAVVETDTAGCVGDTVTLAVQIGTSIGILFNSNANIYVFPNPTSGILTVEGVEGTVSVYDIYGRMVLTTNTNTLDISQAATGIYFVRVVDEQGKVIVGKVLKK